MLRIPRLPSGAGRADRALPVVSNRASVSSAAEPVEFLRRGAARPRDPVAIWQTLVYRRNCKFFLNLSFSEIPVEDA